MRISMVFKALACCFSFVSAYEAGHLRIAAADFTGHVWYPTEEINGLKSQRYLPLPFTQKVRVVENAARPRGKRFPVVLVSHGILGRETSYSWLEVDLARRGYIVIAPHHADQSREDFQEGELFRLWRRPQTITKALDWALNGQVFKESASPREIYFIGHSVGGQTGLWLAGLPFDIRQVLETAENSPSENNLSKRMRAAYASEKPTAEDIAANDKLYGDPRIRKFILLDPTPIYPGFSDSGFRNLKQPLLYVGCSMSEIFNSDWVKAEIVKLNPRVQTMETHAGHFVFADEGTWLGRFFLPRVFRDPPGINRTEVHHKLSQEIANFLAPGDNGLFLGADQEP